MPPPFMLKVESSGWMSNVKTYVRVCRLKHV
jgi:hypothetical protein